MRELWGLIRSDQAVRDFKSRFLLSGVFSFTELGELDTLISVVHHMGDQKKEMVAQLTNLT
ncbi:hypothetical protein GCM10008090_26630 [Arenicella chitinivorans]|uniref:Uncharacterized protein n=1 Tax=Arenicella chitinivorans TaxID=1329800 RepID=A0A918S0F1_9GAMM|nr:hypothetical protein GCM10008090_26630 [Arenicella chitinivorans]